MIITNASPDKFYFNQLKAFLASISINSSNNIVHVFLANYPEDKKSKLEVLFSRHVFSNRKLHLLKDGFSFIQFRAQLIRECFDKYKENVAWIDTDVLVRKDLSDFLDIGSNQIKILYRGDKVPDKVKINAGIFNIGYSKYTYDFILEWIDRISVNNKWGMGQLEFWNAYKKHKDNIELVKMPIVFNDLGGIDRPNCFDKGSIMWHCKKHHFKNKRFQKEFKKYLSMANERIK